MIDPVPLFQENVHWQVVPEYRELLLGPEGLRLEEWHGRRQVRVVKQGAHRTIYQVTLPGLNFFLKHYPLPDWRAWFRQLVRPSKAAGEYHKAAEVARRGVPTFVPLGVGQRRSCFGPGDSFLLTRTLEDTEPLNTFLETSWSRFSPRRQSRLAPRLAQALAGLLARMHDGGIWHRDLHAGNLLVRLDPEDRPALFLIDLHAVVFRGPLDWASSRDNLIMINRWFARRVHRSDRLRFWLAYCRARRMCPEISRNAEHQAAYQARLRDLAHELEQSTAVSTIDFWFRRDRRCLGNNRTFRRLRVPGVVGHAVNDLDPAWVKQLLTDPDEPFRRPGVRLLKNSRSSTVAELEVVQEGIARRFIYKRFRVTSWKGPCLGLFRSSAARRSWILGHGFLERSLPTPRPLLFLQRRGAGLVREGYLLTEKINHALDLHQAIAFVNTLPAHDRRRLLRCLIERVARVIRGLHRHYLSHRDLKASNILVVSNAHGPIRETTDSGQRTTDFLIWLIDLVGVVRHQRSRRSRRVKNLARLHASFVHDPSLTRTDKLRFLRTYLQWGLHGKEGWKKWWHAVDRATRLKIARNLRRGRPLT